MIKSLTTGELVTRYGDLHSLAISTYCPYTVYMDLVLEMESIDEELMQRELDEVSERYTQVDELFDDLMYASDPRSVGSDYDDEDY